MSVCACVGVFYLLDLFIYYVLVFKNPVSVLFPYLTHIKKLHLHQGRLAMRRNCSLSRRNLKYHILVNECTFKP